jgi:hypothetical protein
VVWTLTLSLGTHWMFLQSLAWVGMVVNYSQGATIADALQKTFDGRHPCKLCKLVRAGKATEEKQDTKKPEIKIDYAVLSQTLRFVSLRPEPLSFPTPASSRERRDLPPSPPPEPA